MWQLFTYNARRVVFYAQEEAHRYGSRSVGTEHLLLGLVREESNERLRPLVELGLLPESIRSAVEAHMPRSDARPVEDMTLTPRSKRVIEYAAEEAHALGHNYIGPEHLLLGLLREEESPAQRALE